LAVPIGPCAPIRLYATVGGMQLDKERYEELRRLFIIVMLVIVILFEILLFAGILSWFLSDLFTGSSGGNY
jgi:hypothetical protein